MVLVKESLRSWLPLSIMSSICFILLLKMLIYLIRQEDLMVR